MRRAKKFWSKYLLIIVILTCFLCGCAQTQTKTTMKKPEITYRIEVMEGKPCISINVENVKPPFTVSLLGPDKNTIDFKYVEYQKDLPAVLYFIQENVRPGRYYIRVEKLGNLIAEKTLDLKGSKVSIVESKFNFGSKELLGYELNTMTLKLKGTGDCPAFPYYVNLYISGKKYVGIVDNYNTPTLPGKVQTYTVRDFICYLKKGNYRVKIVVQGFEGMTLGEKTVEVTVP